MNATTLAIALIFFASTTTVSAAPARQEVSPARIRVESAADLPLREYALELPMTELVDSKAALRALAEAIAADLDEVFARYEIVDRALEHELVQAKLNTALARGRWEEASRLLARVRGLEERADLRAVGGLHWEALIATQLERPRDIDAVRDDFRTCLRALLDAQPWDLIHHEIGGRAARTGMLGRGLLDMAMHSTLGTAAAQGGTVDAATAQGFLRLTNGVHLLLPLKDDVSSVYTAYLEDNRRALVDVWGQRAVVLDPNAGYARVRIAVWDSGIDIAPFKNVLWTNAGESPDGVDNDGNGLVDDMHGIAFGPDLRPTPQLLYPRIVDDEAWAHVQSHDDALADLIASIDSPESRALQQTIAGMDANGARAFVNDLMHYAVHSHGTHVAGIAVAGNPFARLVVARVGLDHRDPGPMKTLSWAHRFAAMCHDSVDYFVANDVRVVNMSWGWGIAEIEQNLRDTGYVGADDEIRARARAIHSILAMGIESAIASAPGILFVCGAGNTGDDSSRDRFVPSSLRLQNLVTIGGVDGACRMTAFTSFGDHVRLYANGYRVVSFVPGGERKPQSGTSMSSPQAANLATKLLAIDPTLTPEQLIQLMERGAEPAQFAGDDVFILNPKATVALLEAAD